MDNQSFDILEEKINRIISKMNRLKVENEELNQQNLVLQTTLEEKNREIQHLKQEAENLNTAQSDIESYKENQNRIRTKVESLLDKLKEFDDIQ